MNGISNTGAVQCVATRDRGLHQENAVVIQATKTFSHWGHLTFLPMTVAGRRNR